MYYTLNDGISKAMHYLPLQEENLYLLSIVPTKTASAQFDLLLKSNLHQYFNCYTIFIAYYIDYVYKSKEQGTTYKNRLCRLCN